MDASSGPGGFPGPFPFSTDDTDRRHADWPASATRFLAFRLLSGEDLREAVEACFSAEPETAGFVAACVGSLTSATVRPAAHDDALVVPGPLEIVALSGTLSEDGPHLHIAVADADRHVRGGHLLEGCLVRTTAEIVLGLARGVRFRREQDPRSGYAELFITRCDT